MIAMFDNKLPSNFTKEELENYHLVTTFYEVKFHSMTEIHCDAWEVAFKITPTERASFKDILFEWCAWYDDHDERFYMQGCRFPFTVASNMLSPHRFEQLLNEQQ